MEIDSIVDQLKIVRALKEKLEELETSLERELIRNKPANLPNGAFYSIKALQYVYPPGNIEFTRLLKSSPTKAIMWLRENYPYSLAACKEIVDYIRRERQ